MSYQPSDACIYLRINEEDIFSAIKGLMTQAHGGYACVAMLAGFGIIAFRDPNGIRPLGMCSRQPVPLPFTPGGGPHSIEAGPSAVAPGHGKDYCFTSESVVCDALGFEDFEDIKPGEAVIITRTKVSRRVVRPAPTAVNKYSFSPDIFEYVYFARPDSVLDGISVYRSRMAMGAALADEVDRVLKQKGEKIDVVIPVPDTSRVAALQLAQKLNIPYREGFVKNRYVGRTFIMPGQDVRRKNVRKKLNAMALEFADKNVLLVDDSIVRGTTSKEIIQMARDAGAKKVIMASCAPPIRFSNVYGIDMPSRHELVAHGRTEEEVAQAIQADLVIYQTLSDLVDSVRQLNPQIDSFDCSVFDGKYVTGGVDIKYLEHLEGLRSENAKIKKNSGAIRYPASGFAQPGGEGANDPKMAAPPVQNGSYFGEQAQEPTQPPPETHMSCNGPMNGADDIG